MRELARSLSSHPRLAAWLATKGLVRTFAAVVENVAAGETPAPHLRFLAPKEGFRVSEGRARYFADPRSFAEYDVFGDVVASLDAEGCARLYGTLRPLIDEAHKELGHREGGFDATLEHAVAALLEVPVLGGDVPLVRHATLFEYADRRLEALTPPQKQLLRTGPRNVRLVQAKLREIARALGIPAEPVPAPRSR